MPPATQGHLSFLDAAAVVIQRAGVPLTPQQISRTALAEGLIQSSGQTPEQTIKAKLSTEILKYRDRSRFMRTEKNKFALRVWSDRYEEYVADRYQKALLDEQIVVFSKGLLSVVMPEPGLCRLDEKRSSELLRNVFSMQRREAEEDSSVIQLVSQFLVWSEGRIATYKRTRRLPESRLHGVYSLLFGGHLNPDDVPPLFSILDPHDGQILIQRELSEELRFSTPPTLSLIGAIYDPRREVSRQHLGVFYEVHAPVGTKIAIGERGFLQQLRFETPQEVLDRVDDFENWSELILRSHILPSI
jgi:predicted NUDIX family phosphoesterase